MSGRRSLAEQTCCNLPRSPHFCLKQVKVCDAGLATSVTVAQSAAELTILAQLTVRAIYCCTEDLAAVLPQKTGGGGVGSATAGSAPTSTFI